MNEPQLNPDRPSESAVNRFYRENKTILDRLLMIVVTAILAGVFGIKIDEVKQIGNETKDTATKAAEKADVAADQVVEVKAIASETRANVTGDPKDVAEAKAAKAEVQEVKNGAK